MLLLELDGEIAEMGEDMPDWVGTIETLSDVIDWVEEILSGPYTVPLEMPDETTFDLTVNISALFLTPVADWKTKLPYMEWLDLEEYAEHDELDVWGPYYWNPANPYEALVNGVEMSYNNIVAYYQVEDDWDTDMPVVFLDGPDGDAIESSEIPYFPDYTMGGLFPGMTRDDWLTLVEALD